jgi:hypothetical protein
MKVTVSKALKMKNRLAALIKEKGSNIKENNSIVKDGVRQVDIHNEIENRNKAVDALISLKTAIYRSNMDIQEKVFRLAELKSEIAFWDEVPCDEGLCQPKSGRRSDFYHAYGKKDYREMTTVMRFEDLQKRKHNLIAQIDMIQDELDLHNHTTKIDIPDVCRELVFTKI